jgi:hypothetical protein
MSTEFDQFWASYPKKMARLDAMKAYTAARRMASAEDIQAGLQQYLSHLPEELRFVPHAGTWLRAGRWQDEYDTPLPKPVKVDWYAECQQLHNGACGLDRFRHGMRMRETA